MNVGCLGRFGAFFLLCRKYNSRSFFDLFFSLFFLLLHSCSRTKRMEGTAMSIMGFHLYLVALYSRVRLIPHSLFSLFTFIVRLAALLAIGRETWCGQFCIPSNKNSALNRTVRLSKMMHGSDFWKMHSFCLINGFLFSGTHNLDCVLSALYCLPTHISSSSSSVVSQSFLSPTLPVFAMSKEANMFNCVIKKREKD